MKKNLLFLFLFSFEICIAQQWFPLQEGLSGLNIQSDKVTALCTDTVHHVLFVAGSFQYANDTLLVKNIAKWDGTNWSALITHDTNGIYNGFSGPVLISALVIFHERLFIALNSSLGNVMVSCSIDSFDVAILGIFNDDINSITVFNDSLIVSGAFTQWKTYYTSSTWYSASGIVKWEGGAQWQQVGGGISVGGFSEVNALCVHHNKLYAAGIFENAGGTYCKNIACWNDTSWSAVGSGIGFSGQFDCILHALVSYKNKLYAGGDFYMSDGCFANGLGMWNDTTWSATGVNATAVYALKVHGNKLYFGSDGSSLGTWLWDRVTCYDDSVWLSTGTGPTGDVLALEVFNNDLYAGGVFETIDSITNAGFIARYDPTIIQDTTSIVEVKQKISAINIYPNPATNEIKISNLSPKATQITIYNLLGAAVSNFQKLANANNITLNISDLQVGIYFIHLTYQDGSMAVRKFIRATD